MFDTTWNVDKYQYHYELDHQWDLKKKFILAHKDKYPEDRLICLAQTFCNVHFLGCRYDEPVMELLNQLTEGLIDRNSKWDKQTFVSASDAVEERVRDRVCGMPQMSGSHANSKPNEMVDFKRKYCDRQLDESFHKRRAY